MPWKRVLTVLAAVSIGCAFRPAEVGGGGAGADAAAGEPDANARSEVDAAPGTPDAASPDAGPARPDEELWAYPASGEIVIDGTLEAAWQTADWVEVDHLVDHYDVYADPFANLLVYQLATLYDDDHLYIAVVVTDDVAQVETSNIWNGDSIEIYFDDGDRSGSYETSDFFFVVNSFDLLQVMAGGTPIVERAATTSGTDYAMEIQVTMTGVQAGEVVPFGLAVNDDDDRTNPGGGASNDGTLDAYLPWYFETQGGCQDGCCDGSDFITDHTDPFCDTSRLGTLRFMPAP